MSSCETLRFIHRLASLGQGRDWSPSRVALVQRQRLGRLVRYAVSRSPFFREKYRGLDLHHFQLADLPTTTKRELMQDFDATVTDPAVRRVELEQFLVNPANLGRFYRGRYAVSHTSG